MMRPVSLALPPIKASNLASTVAGSGNNRRLTLTWNDNSITETSFVVQKTLDGTTWTNVGTINSPLDQPNIHQARSLTDPARYDPNVPVKYQVVAENTVGYGAEFPSMTVKSVSDPLMIGTAPAAPTNLTATLQAGLRVNLAWTDNATNEAGFRIQRSTDGGATFTQVGNNLPPRNGTGGMTYVDTTVQPGVNYTYRVQVFNAIDVAYTNTATVTVPALPAAPALTSAKAAASGGGERITVTWGAVTGATGYTIQWSTTSAFTKITGSGTVGNTTTFTTGQLAKQTWYVRVIATNIAGQSPPSAVATVPPLGTAVIPALAPLGAVANVNMAAAISLGTINGAGVPIAVTVPAGAQVLQLQVVTIPGAAAAAKGKTKATKSRVLYQEMRHITRHGPWKKAHRVAFRLRSKALARKLHHKQRYTLVIKPGRNTKTLGKAKNLRFRVR